MTHTIRLTRSTRIRQAAALMLAAALGAAAAAAADEALPPPLGLTAAEDQAAPATFTAETPEMAVAVPVAPPAAEPAATDGAAPADGAGMRFVNLGRITFESGKWDLGDAARRMLNAMAAYLAANPGAERLLLDGHTDWIGGTRYNDALSDKRAAAVQGYLIGMGVDPQLIRWKGRGKHAPADENWSRLGRGRNRQVELFAVYLPR